MLMEKQPTPNLLDRAISIISPKWAAERMRYRYANHFMEQSTRKYEAAARGRRTNGWITASSSANTEIHQALSYLRNRSRDLSRNNPYGENAVREIANNMVGTGIIPKPVDLSDTAAKRLSKAYKTWANGTACDYDGHLNFYGIQSLVVRTVVESGECLIRKRIVKDKSMGIPLQLQVLEPDFIDDTKYNLKLDNGGYIYYGIEFSAENKIVAYWLWENHPGDSFQYTVKSNRIPADEIIHVFEKKRPGQFRGVPFGHASMLRLKDLDDYEDAQLIRQKIAACFSVFVTDAEPVGQLNGKETPVIDKVEPGIIEHLPMGKQVTMAVPPDAGPNYDPYTKSVLRGVACGYGMDYVTLTGDLTAVNFSSGRMGWLKFHRNVSAWQWNMLVPQFCNKSWLWFTQVAKIMGVISVDMVEVSWTPPRREMIDPVKEVEGIEKSIRVGLTSLQSAIRENGDDPDEIMKELVEMAKKLDENGLKLTSDPRFDDTRKPDNANAQPQNDGNKNG
jgi:lambda family phage portal protein